MTLREQCIELAVKLSLLSSTEHALILEAFARQQQAVGLREAVALIDQHHAKDHWYLQKLREQCEQQAREREGTP